jgi:hypothetical protein
MLAVFAGEAVVPVELRELGAEILLAAVHVGVRQHLHPINLIGHGGTQYIGTGSDCSGVR